MTSDDGGVGVVRSLPRSSKVMSWSMNWPKYVYPAVSVGLSSVSTCPSGVGFVSAGAIIAADSASISARVNVAEGADANILPYPFPGVAHFVAAVPGGEEASAGVAMDKATAVASVIRVFIFLLLGVVGTTVTFGVKNSFGKG